MHDVKVKMKDGRVFVGPLWMWRPADGYFTLVLDQMHYPDAPDRILLADVASAINYGIRTRIDVVEDVDLLERARNEGWIDPHKLSLVPLDPEEG